MSAWLRKPTFGLHNPSPIKRRNKKKSSTFVTPPLQDVRRLALLDRLEALRNNTNLNESGMADNIIDQSENDELDEMDPEAMETPMFDDITELGMSFHMFDANANFRKSPTRFGPTIKG
jgi:hypothetical protein